MQTTHDMPGIDNGYTGMTAEEYTARPREMPEMTDDEIEDLERMLDE